MRDFEGFRLGLAVVAGSLGLAAPALALATPGAEPGALALEVPFLVFYLGGLAAYARHPRHLGVVRLLDTGSNLLVALGLGALLSLWVARVDNPSFAWVINAVGYGLAHVGLASLVSLMALFPDGRARSGPIALLVQALAWGSTPIPVIAALVSAPTVPINLGTTSGAVQSPLFVPALASLDGLRHLEVFYVVAALGLLVGRYSASPAVDRARMRWPLAALCLMTTLFVATAFLPPGPPEVTPWLFALLLSALPISLLIGMVRHHLLDVDLLIRRSLVYACLWVAIAALYGGASYGVGLVAGTRLSVELGVALAITASMLFQPARRRLERLADHLVYGARLSDYELLQRFSGALGQTADLGEVGPRAAGLLRNGLGAAWVRITVQETDGRQRIVGAAGGASSASAAGDVAVPLVHEGRVLGRIECGPRERGEYGESELHLLENMGRQAALAIRSASLAAAVAEHAVELAASRSRLVAAEERGRRRLERDLHDGAQQELVALIAKLQLARLQVARGSQRAEDTLAEVQRDAEAALQHIREVAQGLHPAALAAGGLAEAIESRLARLPRNVSVAIDPALRQRRFAPEVESAAYFAILETVTNALKHAGASRIGVHLLCQPDRLVAQVMDDGVGMSGDERGGTGLVGLRDRIEALEGTVDVRTAPGDGTTVEVALPIGFVEQRQIRDDVDGYSVAAVRPGLDRHG